jgi:hypothetical protein
MKGTLSPGADERVRGTDYPRSTGRAPCAIQVDRDALARHVVEAIAGATITAANIAPGQVVKGGGTFVTGRQVVADGAINTPVLTLSGIGQLRATCVAGATSLSCLGEGERTDGGSLGQGLPALTPANGLVVQLPRTIQSCSGGAIR